MSLLRAFGAVHGTVPAAALLAAAAVVSLLLGQVEVTEIGFVRLAAPVSMLLLVPLVSGVAVAVAAVPSVPRSLPDPPVARVARGVWVVAWLVVAVVVTGLGLPLGATATPLAVARNVATLAGLGLLVSRLDGGRHAYLPPTLLVLISVLFGHPDAPGAVHHWWAYVLRDTSGPLDLAIAAALVVVGLVVVTTRRSPRRDEPVRRSAPAPARTTGGAAASSGPGDR